MTGVHARMTTLALLLSMSVAAGPAFGATSSVTVSITIPSATSLTPSGCLTGSAAATFGTVLPGTSSVTTTDCSLSWGSSNDSSMLRVYQQDGRGNAMYLPARGPLDTAGFASPNGVARIDLGSDDEVNAIAVQPDGKIVFVGDNWTGNDTNLTVARYNANGTLDTTFNAAGATPGTYIYQQPGDPCWTPSANTRRNNDVAKAVTLQPDGRIVVAGYSCGAWGAGSSYEDFFLMRLNADGTLDTSFDGDPSWSGYPGNGKAAFSTNGSDQLGAVGVQTDGRIVAAGQTATGSGWDSSLLRLNVDGSLDTSFAGGGKFQVDLGSARDDQLNTLNIQADGRIVCTGNARNATNLDVLVVRFNVTGSLDTAGFNSPTGYRTTPIGGGDDSSAAAGLQADGSIVVAGYTSAANEDWLVARYTPTGALDTSFGAPNGYLVTAMSASGNDRALGLTVLGDDRLVVGGYQTNANADMAFARYTKNGALDTTFNAGTSTPGRESFNISTGVSLNDEVHAVAQGADGNVIAGGAAGVGNPQFWNSTLVQLAGTTVAGYGVGTDWGTAGAGFFGACVKAVGGSGVSAVWTPNATCPATDGAWWQAIGTGSGSSNAKVAQSITAGVTATTNMVFGVRTLASQPPGTYIAPLIFEVAAPNV